MSFEYELQRMNDPVVSDSYSLQNVVNGYHEVNGRFYKSLDGMLPEEPMPCGFDPRKYTK